MNGLLSSFHYTHSPTLPRLLWELGCTLVFSTYQAGKVIFIRATSPEKIEQHALDFPRPMGLAVSDQRIAVATREEVVVLTNASAAESTETQRPDSEFLIGATAGGYVQEKTYFSGEVDTHDLAWGQDGLWAINTLLSIHGSDRRKLRLRGPMASPFRRRRNARRSLSFEQHGDGGRSTRVCNSVWEGGHL